MEKSGLTCEDGSRLLELAIQYLSLGEKENGLKIDFEDKNQLDFKKCERLIQSSFKFDYGYDPYQKKHIHWYDFYHDLENLSSSEFGTCCALNRVASILNMDTSKMKEKDAKKIKQTQKEFRKKYCIKTKKEKLNNNEKENVVSLYKEIGLWKGGNNG